MKSLKPIHWVAILSLVLCASIGMLVYNLTHYGINTFTANWSVAIGTILLAYATFFALIYSYYLNQRLEEKESRIEEKELAKRRLEEFYTPLLVTFRSNPTTVNERWDIIKERVDQMVNILQGKRYLATLDTLDIIKGLDVENVAYFYWLRSKSNNAVTNNELQFDSNLYLKFKTEDEKKDWIKLANQLWNDYVELVKKYHFSDKSQEEKPNWSFGVDPNLR